MANILLSMAAATAKILPAPLKKALYRVGPLAKLIRSSLNRAAPTGMTCVTVAGGQGAGLRLWLDLQDEKDIWLGNYEPELQAAIREFVKPGMHVMDVGANIGFISLLFARAVGPQGRVTAFEALPENVVRLRRNIAENKCDGQVHVEAVAVADHVGSMNFLVSHSGGMGKLEGSTGREKQTYQQTISVPVTSLDAYLEMSEGSTPQVVKMDIEGGEVLAIPGMETLLERRQPLVFLELHGPAALDIAWEALQRHGYEIQLIAPGYPRVSEKAMLGWKSMLMARVVR